MTTLLISAGDASGDLHAADFVRSFRAANPDTRQTLQPTRSAMQGPRVTDHGPWIKVVGQQDALGTYRAVPLIPVAGIWYRTILRGRLYNPILSGLSSSDHNHD